MSLFTELKRRNVIRVAIAYIAGAWLLTEVSGTLFPVFGIPDWGVRFVVIVLALGLLPALIISWAYELTPEGLKREKDVVRETSITHITAKRLDGITIGLIVVALAFIMTERVWLNPRFAVQPASTAEVVTDNAEASEPEPQYPPNSIAVLPFVNMSSDPEQEYFSDGISEELLNLLSKIPEMRVISRSSAFSFKGKELDLVTIATQLNVAYILEGSVRKDGNHIRITAQLIEARLDTHLWSETYDRELENIFAVQDEISAAIVSALKERLELDKEYAPKINAVTNTGAHDAYLRGRYLIVQRTKATIEGAVREFEKAIALDPDYALAHAELAVATILLWSANYGDLSITDVVAKATLHAQKSMALDAGLAEAHAATGLLFKSQGEYEKALAHYEHAIRINPNYSIVYTWMGNLLGTLGRYRQGMEAEEIALRLNPLSKVAINNTVRSLIDRNRLDEAGQELDKIATIYPGLYANLRGDLMSVGGKWANSALGKLDALRIEPQDETLRRDLAWDFAVIGLEKEALAISGNFRSGLLLMLGRPDEAVKIARERLSEDPVHINLRDLGLALASAGDYVHARPILEDLWQWSRGRVMDGGDGFQVDHAVALISIRRTGDEETNAGELLAAIKDDVRRNREAGITTDYWSSVDYEEGIYKYLSGEREKGLALIAKSAEDGFLILPNEAYLQNLYDDPGFAPIRAGQMARQTRERNRFLTIVCSDSPYEEVWQPVEETCEQFFVETQN